MKGFPEIRCVYRIDNPFTGDFYIGSTENFRKRHNKWVDWRYSVSNPKIKADFEKYGFKNFVFSVVETFEKGESVKFRLARELEYIRNLHPTYNTIGNPVRQETREKIRKSLSGKKPAPELVEKRRQSIIARYKETPKDNSWKKKPIIIDGIGYPSVKEGCEAVGCGYWTIRKAIQTGRNVAKGHQIEYSLSKYKKTPEGRLKPIIVDGTEYRGIEKASQKIGVGMSTLWRKMHEGKYLINGHIVCSPEDIGKVPSMEELKRQDAEHKEKIKKNKNWGRTKVYVDGQEYDGIKAAAEALGCSKTTIARRVLSGECEIKGHKVWYERRPYARR